MFVVKGKSGKILGSYRTKAEAERRITQLADGAKRLKGYRFSGSPTASDVMHSIAQANFLEHAWAVWTQPTSTYPWKFHTAYTTKAAAQRASKDLSYTHDVRITHEGYGDAPKSEGSPERQEYTVFKRSKTNPRAVRVVQHDLTLSEARAMCARLNSPRSKMYCEFTTNKNFRESFPRARRLRSPPLVMPGSRGDTDRFKRVLGDVRYGERHRFRGWNIHPNVLQEPRLFPLVFPELTRADHARLAASFHAKGEKVRAQHHKWVKRGGATYGVNGPMISSGFHNDWPESVKETIRRLAHGSTLLLDAARAHAEAAGRR